MLQRTVFEQQLRPYGHERGVMLQCLQHRLKPSAPRRDDIRIEHEQVCALRSCRTGIAGARVAEIASEHDQGERHPINAMEAAQQMLNLGPLLWRIKHIDQLRHGSNCRIPGEAGVLVPQEP